MNLLTFALARRVLKSGMTEAEYAKRLEGCTRAQLLKLCRAAGFAAHKLATDAELIHLLWIKIGSKAFA